VSDWTHTYTYDNARRLSSVGGISGTFNYTYTSASGTTASRLIHRITLPTTSAGPSITNTYDNVGRLLTTHMRNGGTVFNKHDYVVDNAHRRTKQTRVLSARVRGCIPTSGNGDSSSNYSETILGYDTPGMGMIVRSVSPEGTITRMVSVLGTTSRHGVRRGRWCGVCKNIAPDDASLRMSIESSLRLIGEVI
jgi:hypothetical protein